MSQWTQGPGNPQQQQWGVPPAAPVNQPNQGWVQGDSQWGSMQQASHIHQQLHQQSRLPAPQPPGYHGYPQGNPPQQSMSQGAYIQEQLARAREEQRVREVELQKRRMMNMNIAEATPPSSIDRLIGLDNITPNPPKRQPAPSRPSVTMATSQQPQSKPWSWTTDTSNLQGVFSQHRQEEDDSFGEFQGPPPPQSQQPSGVGIVPTSSYTRPIPSLSGSPRMGLRGRSTSSPHSTPPQPHRSQAQPHTSQAKSHGSSGEVNPSAFPPLYLEVYSRCLKNGSLSTELLFPVLMSSQLPKQKLGELWQQANRQTPGKLTQTELFVLLGLIALAQAGNPSPKFADLQKVSSPPVPVLEEKKRMDPLPAVSAAPQTDDFGSFQQGPSLTQQGPSLTPLSKTASKPTTALSPATAQPSSNSPFGTFVPPVSVTVAPKQTPAPSLASKPPASSSAGATSDSLLGTFTSPPLMSAPLISAPSTSAPQSGQSDKFMAFGDLNKSSIQPNTTGDKFGGLEELTSSSDQPPAHLSSSSFNNLVTSDFGSFAAVNAPSQTTSQFADFSTSLASAEGWADFAVPLSTTITPHTILTSHTSQTQPSTTPVLSGLESLSLPSSQLSPMTTTSSPSTTKTVAGSTLTKGSLDIFEPSQEKKPLTGLDILNEEMAARLLSKEGSSKAVVSKPLVPESLDDFGEFEAFGGTQVNGVPSQESAKDNEKSTSDPCKVWKTCLVKCGEVLEKCVGVFEGAEEVGLLVEIAESEEGRNKLRGIVGVYRLARRVYSSLAAKDPGAKSADYCRAIQSHWHSLQTQLPNSVMTQLYSEAPPTGGSESEASDVLSDTISKCSLCLVGKSVDVSAQNSLDGNREEYPLNLLFHNGQSYHASCANFWINVVQEPLPALV